MANWENKTITDIVTAIDDRYYVLPVIQRRLVWDEEKISLLFDTILKGNAFGGIMALEEEKDNTPLFAFRPFSKDGLPLKSSDVNKLNKNQLFIIDGQQRLQSFYIGLLGAFNGKIMFYDLYSDFNNLEFEFRFSADENKLIKKIKDRELPSQDTFWYNVTDLYLQLKITRDEDQVSEEIIKKRNITNQALKDAIRKNVNFFFKNIFIFQNVGICRVNLNRSLDLSANRQRIVELFRRLNDGGTRLNAYDLVASILKGFSWEMEGFLDQVLKLYEDIGITQDIFLKMIFIVLDNPNKEMTDIEASDAEFILSNRDRILNSLLSLRKFLQASKLETYYKEGNRSAIPLYFIYYYIFHSDLATKNIDNIFSKFDTADKNFIQIYKWLYISLLNGVFRSRGAGWIPYKTGINSILEIVKNYKAKDFPAEEIIKLYLDYPLAFYRIDKLDISICDFSFVFYLLYNQQVTIRQQDVDHIHPYNLIVENFDYDKVNSLVNFQLLDQGTNRGLKNGKELKDWIDNHVENKEIYLNRHLIPEDEALWKSINFLDFYEARKYIVLGKLKRITEFID